MSVSFYAYSFSSFPSSTVVAITQEEYEELMKDKYHNVIYTSPQKRSVKMTLNEKRGLPTKEANSDASTKTSSTLTEHWEQMYLHE